MVRSSYLRTVWILLFGIGMLVAAGASRATDRYVAVNGTPTGQGTKDSPWDIVSALSGKQRIAPGDTLWLRHGTYVHPFQKAGVGFLVHLAGTADAPIIVRAYPGEHVTIDGGLSIQPPATYVWIWDLEVTVSAPYPRTPPQSRLAQDILGRPWGGVSIYSGTGCKYIDLVIHNNSQGMGFWSGAKDSEVYGCVFYNNGNRYYEELRQAGVTPPRGHDIYTQNETGTKVIADCIMTGGYDYTIHAYSAKRAHVDNYIFDGNIIYNAGPVLIGGVLPSHNISLVNNVFYGIKSIKIGETSNNEDLKLRNNIIVNSNLKIVGYDRVVQENNQVLASNAPRPTGTQTILRANKYDPDRANLAILNWDKRPTVSVDASAFLKAGDRYRLMDPTNFYGQPVLTGTYNGEPLNVPVSGEFAAFVLLRRSS